MLYDRVISSSLVEISISVWSSVLPCVAGSVWNRNCPPGREGMDHHAPQKTPTFQMTTDNIVPVYTSPDCTDCVAPVDHDHHVGARLKQVMGLFYHTVTHDHGVCLQAPGGFTGFATCFLDDGERRCPFFPQCVRVFLLMVQRTTWSNVMESWLWLTQSE